VWSIGGGSGWTLVEWLLLIERELLVFAAFWFLIGSIDELLVDGIWFALRLNPQNHTPRLDWQPGEIAPIGKVAVFVAAWREAEVIGATIERMLSSWAAQDFVLYIGCYGNDPATVAAAVAAGAHDPRLRVVIHENFGPTTKADCLNRLYRALCADEARRGMRFHGVVLHDSEDMVHPMEMTLIDQALSQVDFVQLPVHPEIPEGTHWIAGHYCDEFADSHARQMVVRDWLGAAIPAAGVSCGFARDMLDTLVGQRALRGKHGSVLGGPFASECFTEDYELGMLIKRMGGTSRFLRCRDADGELIGTRSYFPDTLVAAVKQKTRWIHGICLQSWDRLGWNRSWVDRWMMLRDRRGPLTALVLFSGYALALVEGLLAVARWYYGKDMPVLAGDTFGIRVGMALCAAAAVWRIIMRFVFTTREYGVAEGRWAIARQPLANVIMIMAGRRAVFAYCRTLVGFKVAWEKTEHHLHPAMIARKLRR